MPVCKPISVLFTPLVTFRAVVCESCLSSSLKRINGDGNTISCSYGVAVGANQFTFLNLFENATPSFPKEVGGIALLIVGNMVEYENPLVCNRAVLTSASQPIDCSKSASNSSLSGLHGFSGLILFAILLIVCANALLAAAAFIALGVQVSVFAPLLHVFNFDLG